VVESAHAPALQLNRTLAVIRMAIASIGTVVRVTPGDDLQVVRGLGDQEWVDDRSPFRVRVSNILREDGILIGVSGPVIDGHPRYHGLVATLLTRIDDSHWETDTRSGVNFKVGPSVARRVGGLPHSHPDGTLIDGFPFIVRYGNIDVEG
jgi:hypothetical protein